jgi:IclR family transcriptional regulator, pca regulon regulatory protein
VDEAPESKAVEPRARHFVQSLERGLAVIRAFDAETPALTLSDVARRTGLTRAAARRFLLTLADLTYVQSDGRYFRLTPRVLELGYAYLSSLSLPRVALPYLEQLVAAFEESSEASILDEHEIVYIMRIPGPRIMTVAINVGARMPAHATSMGRVLLAGLDDVALERYLATAKLRKFLPRTTTDPTQLRKELLRVRRQGYAIIDQELEEGLRAVAVPIHDRSGQVIAAANLSTHAARRSLDSLRRELLPALLRTVKQIENDLLGAALVESSPA